MFNEVKRFVYVYRIFLASIGIWILYSSAVFALPNSVKSTKAKSKHLRTTDLKCAKKSLQLRDCHLTLGKNKIQIWHDKIFLISERGRDTQDLVLRDQVKTKPAEPEADKVTESPATDSEVGEKVDEGIMGGAKWSSASIRKMGQRTLVEFLFWTPPEVETSIEAQRWLVYEIVDTHIVRRLDKVIQKRKLLESRNKYKMDKLAKFGLDIKKNEIHWKVDLEHGSF